MTAEYVTRTRPKLNLAQREEIVRRYLDGEAASQLALEFNVRATTIRHFLPPRPKNYSKESA